MIKLKLTFVGIDDAGTDAAHQLVGDGHEIVLLDPKPGHAAQVARRIARAVDAQGMQADVVGGTDWRAAAGSQVVIVIADCADPHDPRSPNVPAVMAIAKNIRTHTKDALVIVATNPVAAVCHVIHHGTRFPAESIIGTDGVMEGRVLRSVIRGYVDKDLDVTGTYALGYPGDEMVLPISPVLVDGRPLAEVLEQVQVDEIVDRTRAVRRDGPAAAVAWIVRALLRESGTPVSCTVLSSGVGGIESGVFVSILAELSLNGASIVPMPALAADERTLLEAGIEQMALEATRLRRSL
jgi:malate dehydrogenase